MEATYIRVSTIQQNTITQEVKSKGEKYVDKVIGIIPFSERPNSSRLMGDISIGKVKHVYVSRIDRLGRDAFDIMKTIEFLKSHKCQLTVTSLNLSLYLNGKVNPMFMLMTSIYSQLSEQQREEIKEKTSEGIAEAKKRGVYMGRKRGTSEDKAKFISKHKDIVNCIKSNMSLNKAMETTGKSKPTIIKVKRLIAYN